MMGIKIKGITNYLYVIGRKVIGDFFFEEMFWEALDGRLYGVISILGVLRTFLIHSILLIY